MGSSDSERRAYRRDGEEQYHYDALLLGHIVLQIHSAHSAQAAGETSAGEPLSPRQGLRQVVDSYDTAIRNGEYDQCGVDLIAGI